MLNKIEQDMQIQRAYEDGYAKGREEGAKIATEIERKLSEKCNSLAEESQKLRAIETEFFRLRAQMDIVYLIFGGK